VSYLREDTCRKGVPLRKLWTAEEARTVKSFVNNLRVQLWNLPYTQVDPDEAVIYLPAVPAVAGGDLGWSGIYWMGNIPTDVAASENKPLFEWDDDDGSWIGAVTGRYLFVNMRTGDYYFEDEIEDAEDANRDQCYYVADKVEETEDRDEGYAPSSRVQGDIYVRVA